MLLGREFSGQPGQAQLWPVRGAFGGYPQGQRQAGATGDDRGGGIRLSVHPGLAEDLLEQGNALGCRERPDGDRCRAVPCQQAGKPAPAGHQHQAAWRPGKQRPDLPGDRRVVQQDQHVLAGKQGPVQGGGLVCVAGYLSHAQCAQEPP